jgi:diphthine synthase
MDGISKYGLEIAKKCKRVYLENYTIDFPYSSEELQEVIGKKIIPADRELVESLELVDKSKKMDICLLVFGSPLTATTHISLIQEAKEQNVKYKIIHSASILDAVAETGLQIYKFGKIASMPEWKKNFTPESFMEILQQNISINAHTLILIDIGLEFSKALEQLEISAKNKKIKLNNIVVCQSLGTRHRKILYKNIKELKEIKIKKPFCIIIPDKLHFVEKEFLKNFE